MRTRGKLRKLLSLTLALLFVLSLLPAQARAATDGDWTYSISGNAATITKYNGRGGNVTIPSTLGGQPVTAVGYNAFFKCTSLIAVTIPTGVTTIGDFAFSGCSGLTTVNIPAGVTTIGDFAFSGCSSLTTVTIPAGVTTIGNSTFSDCSGLTIINVAAENPTYCSVDGVLFSKNKKELVGFPVGRTGSYIVPAGVTAIKNGAFSGCSGLTTVVIPNSVTTIEDEAFLFCDGLTTMTIPNSVTAIGDYAFSGCTGLTAVTIPNSITSMGYRAFYSCWYLTTVTISTGVTSIGESAFENCYGLNTMDIPNSVTAIGYRPFVWCTDLTRINVAADNPAYCSVDGILFNKDKKQLIIYPAGRTGSYAIPDGVTAIGDSAFETCSGLTTVDIPNSVTSIGDYAFLYCDGLTTMTIPNSITSIGDHAFACCTGLTDVYYGGTSAEWAEVAIGSDNSPLVNATIHYTFSGSPTITTPVLVNATAAPGQITVKWNGVANAAKYAVYRKTAGGSWTLLTTSVTGTSYVDKSSELVAGTVYFYTVKALVNGTWSNCDGRGVSATAIASTTPVLKSAAASAGQITVTWNEVSGASKYAVYRKTAGGSWTLLTTSVTGTTYADTSSLTAGTTYYYTVKSLVNGTWSGYDAVGVSAAAIASTTPVLKSATASAGQITVTWNEVSGASKYAVYRKTAGGSWTLLTTSVTGTTYADTSSLTAGTTYYYTVKSLVNGTWSGYDAVGVSAAAIASTTPVLKSATASAGQIKVTWNAVAGASKYAVYRKTAGGNWTLLTTSVTGTTYADTSSLTAGTTYCYTVKSLVNGTWSGYDAVGVSAAAMASTTPVLTGATAAPGQITVKWNAVAGASKYAVYRKTAGGSWTLLTTSVTGTTYADTSSLTAGTTYYYTVKSLVNGTWSGYDAVGVSAAAMASTTPVLVSATASPGQIQVSWNAVAGASKYAVYRKTAGGSWTLLTTSVTGTTYADTSSLTAGTTYYYTVKSLVNGTWSGYDAVGVSAAAK